MRRRNTAHVRAWELERKGEWAGPKRRKGGFRPGERKEEKCFKFFPRINSKDSRLNSNINMDLG